MTVLTKVTYWHFEISNLISLQKNIDFFVNMGDSMPVKISKRYSYSYDILNQTFLNVPCDSTQKLLIRILKIQCFSKIEIYHCGQ